ncbi:MAG TPA: ABC transporter ATP-binding protein [Solirubrobacteraceae bacterium]|nr:ABC transporter ATP-binding protein [Solirubrobacteraceae bacterium]
MPDGPAIVVDGVSKTFRVPEERTHTFKERALHPLRRLRNESFAALSDVSFAIERGEFFGIVGRNGSGKSTLLKCLAGIYGVDSGRIWCRGRISTFIELGVGFNPDLAAFDNVVTNGIMLGLSPREARMRYERIIEFAELQDFQDLKLKNYSSGMHVRLAFSVAIQVDADILLIDEVLAVGDASFQQKCFDVFNRMRDEGKTIVFVTHDMGAVNRFCHRAVLLERGDQVLLGEPDAVGDRYLAMNFGRDDAAVASGAADWDGSSAARIVEAWFEDGAHEQWGVYLQGYVVRFNARVVFEQRVVDPALKVQFENEAGQDVFIASTAVQHERSGTFEAGEEAVFSVEFENRFSPGRYFPVATLARRGAGLDMIARSKREIAFLVQSATAQGGLVDLPYAANIERVAAPEPGHVHVA